MTDSCPHAENINDQPLKRPQKFSLVNNKVAAMDDALLRLTLAPNMSYQHESRMKATKWFCKLSDLMPWE